MINGSGARIASSRFNNWNVFKAKFTVMSEKSLVIFAILLLLPDPLIFFNEILTMQQGVVLMVVGMGVVFCFLVLLVFAVKVMGAVLRNVATAEPAPSAAPQPVVAQDDSAIVAVAAAKRFRQG